MNKKMTMNAQDYKHLLDEANDGILLIDNDHTICYTNKKARQILGGEPEKIIDIPFRELIHPDERNRIIELMENRFRQKTVPDHYETTFLSKDGKNVPIELSAKVVNLDGNQFDLVVFRDITDRKKMEKELTDGEMKYRLVVNNIPDVVWITDQNRETTFISDNVEKIYGFSPQEIYGNQDKLWLGRIHQDDIDTVESAFDTFMGGQDTFDVEYRIQRKDGEWIWLHDHAYMKTDHHGIKQAYGVFSDITDRKRESELLRDREQKFGAIIDHGFQLTGLLTPDGILVEVNNTALNLVGASKEDVIGKPFWETPWWNHSDASQKKLRENIEKASAGEVARYEEIHYDAKGAPHCIDFSVKPVINGAGEIVFLIPEGRDVTDQKNMIQSLKESEEKFSAAFHSSPDAIIIVELETGKILEVNEGFEKLFEFKRNEISGNNIRKIDVWEDYAERDTVVSKLKNKKQIRDFAVKAKSKSGVPLDLNVSMNLIDIGGKHCVLSVIRDVTDWVKASEALRESQDRLIQALGAVGLGTWDFYTDTQMLKRDLRYMQLREPTLNDEFTLNDYTKRIHPDDREEFIQKTNDILKGKTPFLDSEHRYEQVYGEYTWFHAQGRVVERNAGGEPLRIAGVLRNITDRKLREEEQAKLESQLRQAQKMEAIGTLAGGIAHDFNNILSPIIGFTEMSVESLSGYPEVRDDLIEVLDAANRAKELVMQILVFSRQREKELKPLNIIPVIKEATKLLRSSIPSTIDFDFHTDISHATIMGDPTQIHQIIMNLCTNAYQAMDAGGTLSVIVKQVEIGLSDKSDQLDVIPGAYVLFSVTDTGQGIDKPTLSRIFDPYFTTKQPGEGTGLGLAVVHGIVKSYGGGITVYSEIGKGTTFNVYLPLIETGEKKEDKQTGKEYPKGDERILFVDDEDSVVHLFKRMFTKLGYTVTTFNDSLQALDEFRQHPDMYDLVISDNLMPNMDGLALSRKLLAIRPDIPIIVSSGFSERKTQDTAKAIGVKAFLLKPLLIQEIANTIRSVLDENKKNNHGSVT